MLTAVIFGLVGELILKSGKYKDKNKARLGFSISFLAVLGNWFPFLVSKTETINQMLERGYNQQMIDEMLRVMPDWIMGVMLITGFIGAYLGCGLGMTFLRKYLEKIDGSK